MYSTSNDCKRFQENPGVGREKLVGGIQRFKEIYPDIKFQVTEACACPDSSKVGTCSGTHMTAADFSEVISAVNDFLFHMLLDVSGSLRVHTCRCLCTGK